MSLPLATQRMTKPLLLIAAIVVVLAYSIWGAERGSAALIGASLSVGNWFALNWLTQRLSVSDPGHRLAPSLLMVGKVGLLMAIVFVLIHHVRVDAIGLAFGLGVLFIGPVLAALLAGQGTSRDTPSAPLKSAVRSTREER
jgi:hypothetical protein